MAQTRPPIASAPDETQAPVALPRYQTKWMMALARIPSRHVATACVLPVLGGILLLVQAWWLAKVLDGVVVHGTPVAVWWHALALIGGLMVVRAGLVYLSEQAGARASEQIKLSLRCALFERMAEQGPHWSRNKVSGELAAALLEQVEALDGFFSKYLPAMITAAMLPVVFAVALMPFDLIAGLIVLLTAPLIPLFMALVGWGAQSASRRHMRAMTRLSGFFADRLRGAATLKLFRREAAEAKAVALAAEGIRERTMAVLRIAFLSSAVLEFFAALGVAAMAVYFGLTFLDFLNLRSTPLTLHVALFCLIMAPEVYAPLRQFAAHYHDRATAQAAVAELDRVFDALPEMTPSDAVLNHNKPARQHADTALAPTLPPLAGLALQVRALSVQHSDASEAVLSDVTFDVPQGSSIALMGASGAGKSTLLDALARLRPYQGNVVLQSQDLTAWDEPALRARLAYIGQRPYLFEGTIAENIRLAAADADDAALRRAAELACVTRFTDLLPEGLDTRLGPRGQGLSGGQAHRVALARLYLRAPAVILLDEPTAHLDIETQREVMHGIKQFAAGRTLVIATHSQAVAAQCDRCFVVANGRLSLMPAGAQACS